MAHPNATECCVAHRLTPVQLGKFDPGGGIIIHSVKTGVFKHNPPSVSGTTWHGPRFAAPAVVINHAIDFCGVQHMYIQ